jgi:hypothetical protein
VRSGGVRKKRVLDERRQRALGGRVADGKSTDDDGKQEDADQQGEKRTKTVAMRDLLTVGEEAGCGQNCQGSWSDPGGSMVR